MKIKIADIEVPTERLRDLRPRTVEAIAQSMKALGQQLQPILVRLDTPKPRLVAGEHRIAAAQKCGWPEIDVQAIDLAGLSKAMADIVCKIAEVDENVHRADLDYAERLLFIDARINLTAARIALEKLEADEKAKAAAKGREEKNVANVRMKRAAKTAAKVSTASSLANEQPVDSAVDGRLPNNVLEQVVKDTGLHKGTLMNARSIATQVGRDNLRKMSMTPLATQSEVQGFVKLQKVAPDKAKECITRATYDKAHGIGVNRQPGQGIAYGYSPSGQLGVLIKREKEVAAFEALKTDEGKFKAALKILIEMDAKAAELRLTLSGVTPENKAKVDDVFDLKPRINALVTRFHALAKPVQQKRTGDEHKYSNEVQKPSKAEVRKSLKPAVKTFEKSKKKTATPKGKSNA